ncbi:MAG: hypothetical protein K2Q33_07630 [Gammaproteobacteria bacterium]|nr:hypothetical protein [Gammaproteobacteria bacterium]
MARLTRYDNVEFVVLTYRELLTAESAGMVKREIQLLAAENGQYVKCFQREQGVEAIFSKDSGYLLAESVWDHFGEPDNLIYCEELPGGNNAVLVVIRGGTVFLDTEVNQRNLMDELAAISLGSVAYQIKLFGDLPIGEERDQFQFPRQNIDKIEWVEASVFLALKPKEEYALGSVKQAFASLGYTQAALKKLFIFLVVLGVIGFIGWWIFKPSSAPPPPPVVEGPPPPPPDPYQAFKQALMTPAPATIVEDLINTLNNAYGIPGWTPQSLSLTGSAATVTLSKDGGNAGILLAWKRSHPDVQLSINTGQAVLTYTVDAPPRSTPEVIYKLPDLLANFYDELNAKFPGSTVSVGAINAADHYQQSTITLGFNDQSPDSLMVLVDVLKGLPVVLNSVTMTVSNGLISGQLVIQLIGA